MASQQCTKPDPRPHEARLLRYLAMNARSPVEFENLLRKAQSLDTPARAPSRDGADN